MDTDVCIFVIWLLCYLGILHILQLQWERKKKDFE